jgi:hypothetical protein
MTGREFISVPVPVDRVDEVYRLLAGVKGTFTFGDPVPAFEPPPERKAPQCRQERWIDGDLKRCLLTPKHRGRHRFVPMKQWGTEEEA